MPYCRNLTKIPSVVFLLLFAIGVPLRAGLPPCPEKRIEPGDGVNGDSFGNVAISGDWLMVGAPNHDEVAVDSGAVYVYERVADDWVFTQKLSPSIYFGGMRFGQNVSMQGDVAVIGVPDAWEAFVFRNVGGAWTQEQRLAPDPKEFDFLAFGWSTDIFGDRIVVGVIDVSHGWMPSTAFVFRYNGTSWMLEQELIPNVSNPDFGWSISGHGSFIAASTPNGNRANVFHFDGASWNEQPMITGPFNFRIEDVEVLGDTLFISSGQDDEFGEDAGAVYVFNYSGTVWNFTQKLRPSDTGGRPFFGRSIDAQPGLLIVGAPGDDEGVTTAGAVYAFRKNQGAWSQTRKIRATGSTLGQGMGLSVSLDEDQLAGGAIGYNVIGAAYVFDIGECATVVPATSTWGLTFLGLGTSIAATLLLIRRKAACALMTIFTLIAATTSVSAETTLRARKPFHSFVNLTIPSGTFRLVVKFRDELKVRSFQQQAVSRSERDIVDVRAILNHHGAVLRTLIQISEATLAEMEQRAAQLSGEMQPDLAGMHVVEASPEVMQALATQLAQSSAVEWAQFQTMNASSQEYCNTSCPSSTSTTPDYFDYVEAPVADACPDYPDDCCELFDYHGVDPGLNATWARTEHGANGSSIKYAVLDDNINTSHEDIGTVTEDYPSTCSSTRHGTAVMGIMSALNNDLGWLGLAPAGTRYFYSICPDGNQCFNDEVASALTYTCGDLAAGDVVIIPYGASVDGVVVPVDYDLGVYTVTQICRSTGISVIESATNFETDLDDVSDPRINIALHNLRYDSGAIIVRAGTPDANHERCNPCGPSLQGIESAFGDRVNLQAWGDWIATLGSDPDSLCPGRGENKRYTRRFGGTSGAAPMVAGAVAVIQSYLKANTDPPCTLKPLNMRQLLIDTGYCQNGSSRTNGVCPNVSEHIGEFPNIRAAIEKIDDYVDDDVNNNNIKDACEYFDCNHDNTLDIYQTSTLPDCDGDGIPNACERDRDCDSVADDCDNDVPIGACCGYYGHACVSTTQCECTAGGGTFRTGPGCFPAACCNGSSCSYVNACQCATSSGTLYPLNDCTTLGACCAGTCAQTTKCACSGAWFRKTNCSPDSCSAW